MIRKITIMDRRRTKNRIPTLKIAMITARKQKVLKALDKAVSFYGYGLDSLFSNRTRKREYTDLRAIVWLIYQEHTQLSETQISSDFNWNRGTIFNAIRRARELKEYNRNFSDMYDSIQGVFSNALANIDDEQSIMSN